MRTCLRKVLFGERLEFAVAQSPGNLKVSVQAARSIGTSRAAAGVEDGRKFAIGSFPNHWKHPFEDSPLSDVTPHVLHHSFASIANDLGFTEVTIAALVGHTKGSVTSKYIHALDTALIMPADTISGYIQGLLDGIEFKQTAYALDRDPRKAALARFLKRASGAVSEEVEEERRLAA
jgi:hypothetical protein